MPKSRTRVLRGPGKSMLKAKQKKKSRDRYTLRDIVKTATSRKFARGFQKGFNMTKPLYKYAMPIAKLGASMIAGSGDYRLKNVGGRSGKAGHSHARVRLEKGEMVIEHSEYLGDLVIPGVTVQGSSKWQSQIYGLNPGNAGTFPWLSTIATNFQDWKADKIVFEYRPLVADGAVSANNSLLSMGSVVMATQYNSTVGPYTSKQTAAESDYAQTVKPSEGCVHAIECDVKYNPLGVLYTSPQTSVTYNGNLGGDIRMNNLGIFQASSYGVPQAANAGSLDLGELWVHYKIRLMKPQLGAPFSILSAHYVTGAGLGNLGAGNPWGNPNAAAQPVQPTPTYLNPYTGQTIVNPDLLTLQFGVTTVPTSTVQTVTFPLSVTTGRFMFTYQYIGSGNNTTAPAVAALANFVNCQPVQVQTNTEGGYFLTNISQSPANATALSSIYMMTWMIDVIAPGAALASFDLTLPGANTAYPANPSDFELFCTEYNQGQY